MAGAIVLGVAMVLLLPTALFAGGALWSALLGQALSANRPEAADG